MRFGDTPIDEATGAILAHSWRANGINFSKGRRLSAEDVAKLKAAGASHVVAARLEPGDIHEDQAAESVAQGGVSMEIQWPGILAGLIDPQKSKVVGKMAFGPPPIRGPLGGWGIAMSSWSKNKEAGWLMMNYLTTSRIQREYAPRGYAITAKALFTDPDVAKV